MTYQYSLIGDAEDEHGIGNRVRKGVLERALGWIRMALEAILFILVVVLVQIVCQNQRVQVLTSDLSPSCECWFINSRGSAK